jgi:hypothetical protein
LIAEEAVAKLFARFVEMLQAEGFQASGGQIIDSAFGEAPRQCTGRDDTEKSRKAKLPPIGAANTKSRAPVFMIVRMLCLIRATTVRGLGPAAPIVRMNTKRA